MNFMLRFSLVALLLFSAAIAGAQNTTRVDPADQGTAKGTCKILLIPFNPKLYLSEVDKKIGTENKMTFEQIRTAFRTGLDSKISLQLKSVNITYSLLSDTVKNRKELERIYKSIGYDYDIPLADGAVAKSTAGQKDKPAIQNGQLTVEMNDEFRFMNAKINDPKLLPYLQEKYKADVFVFINQLDIKKNEASYDIITDTYTRDVIVHYTVFDKSGKRINAGVATSSFPSTINDPKAIINTAFTQAAKTISTRVSKSAPYIVTDPAGTTPGTVPANTTKQK